MNPDKIGRAYGEALAKVNRAERRLVRSFNAWLKARARLQRLSAQLDAAQRQLPI